MEAVCKAKGQHSWRPGPYPGGKADRAARSLGGRRDEVGTGKGIRQRDWPLPQLGGQAQPGARCRLTARNFTFAAPRRIEMQARCQAHSGTRQAGASSGTAAYNHSKDIQDKGASSALAGGPSLPPLGWWRRADVRRTPSTYTARAPGTERSTDPGGSRLYRGVWGSDITQTIHQLHQEHFRVPRPSRGGVGRPWASVAAGRWARARRAGVRPGRAPPPELGRAIPMMPSHRARLPERGRRSRRRR